MIVILRNTHRAGDSVNDSLYRMAGVEILSDCRFAEMEAFRVENTSQGYSVPKAVFAGEDLEPIVTHDDSGWLGGENRRVHCRRSAAAFALEVEGIGCFEITPASSLIRTTQTAPEATAGMVEEVLFGPALSLALAWQGIFCLHASAATYKGQLNLFLGESGRGKSTLADYLGTVGPDWRRIADDTLPVELGDQGLQALLRYPQAKLPSDEQPWLGLPERMPVKSIYTLEISSLPGSAVELHRFNGARATLALAQHGVASRLFDQVLLASHLEFCAQAARFTPIKSLKYERQYEELDRVRLTLEADLAG